MKGGPSIWPRIRSRAREGDFAVPHHSQRMLIGKLQRWTMNDQSIDDMGRGRTKLDSASQSRRWVHRACRDDLAVAETGDKASSGSQ